jgi:hypothetical protein
VRIHYETPVICSFQATESGETKHSGLLLLNCRTLFILLPEMRDISFCYEKKCCILAQLFFLLDKAWQGR